MTTVMLLGGSGFLGRHVGRALLEHGDDVRVVTPGRAACDLLRAPASRLQQLLRDAGPDVVVACTGRLDGTTTELVEANTLVTARLLDALAEVPARLVRIGSAGEYGVVPEGVAVHEEAPVAPVGPYGATHLAATHLVEQAREAGRVDGVSLRVFNPVGAGMNADTVLGRAALAFAEARRTGRERVHLGPLSASRDFVDARDVAAAVVSAALTESPWGVLNVGSGRATRVRHAVLLLARVAGFEGEVVERPVDPGRSTGVDWIQADISRARSALRWHPTRFLADTLEQVWARASTSTPASTRRRARTQRSLTVNNSGRTTT